MSAVYKLIPRPQALVDRRNIKLSDSADTNSANYSSLSSRDVVPSILENLNSL